MFQFLVIGLFSLLLSACGPVQSSLQEIIAGDAPADETYAGRQHLPVTPQEAVEVLIAVAPQHGWQVVNTGDEYDGYSQRGKFFRIETDAPSGERKSISGIFYAERTGAYVRISENNGLPEALVAPLIAGIKEKKSHE